MADKSCKSKPGSQLPAECNHLKESEVVKVEFIITTYPELRPFLEMVVVLLEGVYELNTVNSNTS